MGDKEHRDQRERAKVFRGQLQIASRDERMKPAEKPLKGKRWLVDVEQSHFDRLEGFSRCGRFRPEPSLTRLGLNAATHRQLTHPGCLSGPGSSSQSADECAMRSRKNRAQAHLSPRSAPHACQRWTG